MSKGESRAAYNALMKFYPLALDDLAGEQWRNIAGYEGLYQVSTFGRVKSFWSKTPRILKPTLGSNGYLGICLCKCGKKKSSLIHRVVAEAFIPNSENKREVNHKDGIKLNCYVGNLEWVTPSENHQHAYDTGLKKAGEEHGRAKLTNTSVLYIRENPDNMNTRELAERFGVDQSIISDIQIGNTWKKVGGKLRKGQSQKYTPRLTGEIRNQIRAEYQMGVIGYSSRALAKKYGIDHSTVLAIVHEK